MKRIKDELTADKIIREIKQSFKRYPKSALATNTEIVEYVNSGKATIEGLTKFKQLTSWITYVCQECYNNTNDGVIIEIADPPYDIPVCFDCIKKALDIKE